MIQIKTIFSLKPLMLASVMAISFAAMSQTKKVAHQSHSGSAATLRNEKAGNFGETPEMRKLADKRKAEEDSVKKKEIEEQKAALRKKKAVPAKKKAPVKQSK